MIEPFAIAHTVSVLRKYIAMKMNFKVADATLHIDESERMENTNVMKHETEVSGSAGRQHANWQETSGNINILMIQMWGGIWLRINDIGKVKQSKQIINFDSFADFSQWFSIRF